MARVKRLGPIVIKNPPPKTQQPVIINISGTSGDTAGSPLTGVAFHVFYRHGGVPVSNIIFPATATVANFTTIDITFTPPVPGPYWIRAIAWDHKDRPHAIRDHRSRHLRIMVTS
jgi:hypothetical protein